MFKFIYKIWTHSLARQLTLGIVLVHTILMTIFVFDLVEREREFMLNQNIETAKGLAHTLATNGTSWILSSDFIGIEEVINSQGKFPFLKYAMFINMQGKVLGFTDREQVGRFVSDELSRSLLVSPKETKVLVDNPFFVDVASPVIASGKQIGWARVGISRSGIHENLTIITNNGMLYIAAAIAIGVLFAWFMAGGMTKDIRKMVGATTNMRMGEGSVKLNVTRDDELGILAKEIDSMFNVVTNREREIKRSNEDLKKFAFAASHDLKEPLRMVTSYINILKQRYSDKLDEDGHDFMAFAVKGADRMRILIDDLLAYSIISNSDTKIEPVDCNKIADDITHDFKSSGVNIIKDDLPVVMYEEVRMRQLFLNLISNAIKYKSDDAPHLIIKVKKFSQGELDQEITGMNHGWLFSFEDNGIGFKQEYADKVFQIFQRLHTSDEYSGTGMGLAICNRIVTDSGGKIWVESELGKGTTFYFTCSD